MHIYTAKDRGYFAQEGLDVEVLVTRGQICTMALINGQMELTTNPNVFDAMVAGKFKGKVIYVTAKTLGHRFMVAPDIKSFADLKQKSIAISTFGGLTDMLSREILEQHGIQPNKDVAMLQLGTPDLRYGALKAGAVKGALVVIDAGTGRSKGRISRAALRSAAVDVFAHRRGRRFVSRERPMLRSFVKAVTKGHIYYGQYPAQASRSRRKYNGSRVKAWRN